MRKMHLTSRPNTGVMTLSLAQGGTLISLARRSLDSIVRTGDADTESYPAEPYLREKRGAFVTLKVMEGAAENLRGCVGFPYPVKELGNAVLEAAIAAASEDPRFAPVTVTELDRILVEVSALTLPQAFRASRAQDLPSQVQIGKDGLVVSDETRSGLLLPQVAIEFGLGPSDFLSEACMKAGLLPDAWLTNSITVKKFQAEVFAEERPNGPVKRLSLSE